MHRLWLVLVGMAVSFPFFFWWRAYPWQLAFLMSAAVGAFTYAFWRTVQRQVAILRPDEEAEEEPELTPPPATERRPGPQRARDGRGLPKPGP